MLLLLLQAVVATLVMMATGLRAPRGLGMDNTGGNMRIGVLRIIITRLHHIMRARTIVMVTGTLVPSCQEDLIIAPRGLMYPLLRPDPIITGTTTIIATPGLGTIMIIPDPLQGALPLVVIIVRRLAETITLQTILRQILGLLVHHLKDHPPLLSLPEEVEEEEVILGTHLLPLMADRFIANQYLRQGMSTTLHQIENQGDMSLVSKEEGTGGMVTPLAVVGIIVKLAMIILVAVLDIIIAVVVEGWPIHSNNHRTVRQDIQ